MIYTRHSHCFSKSQLEIIIDGYLSLSPYYAVLLKALKLSTQKHEEQVDPHRTDKPHPIRVYTRDHQCSKNILDDEGQNMGEPRGDLRSTYASTNIRYFYLFPLEYVIEILSSAEFYRLLPQNLIINGLLTATNLQIIIETLIIVSEDMSKKIRITIAGKQLASSQPEQDPIVEENRSFASFRESSSENLPMLSIVQIALEDENGSSQIKPSIFEKSAKLIKRQIAGTRRFITIDREISENECRFCQGYLIYLYETVGQNPLDEDINRLSMESSRCLNIISKVVPHFTLYLANSNQLEIPNDVHTINRIINPMGLVITQQIFSSELNPKCAKPAQTIYRRPKNLIQELQPYFKSIQKKKTNENTFSIQQLFRMIIYSPTTEEVSKQLKQQKADQFDQEKGGIRTCLKDDKVKTLLKKECEEMKAFQKERLKIAQHMIDIKPIYKQLQFPEKPLQMPNTKPNNYNVFNPSKNNQSKMLMMNDRSLTVGTHETNSNHQKTDNKTLMFQLFNSVPRTDDSKKSKLQKKSSKDCKLKKKKNQDEVNIPDFGTLAMSAVFKRSALKNPQECKSNNWLTINNLPQNLTTSTEILETSLKIHSGTIEEQGQLSDIQFKKILLNNYSKKQTIKQDNFCGQVISSPKIGDQYGTNTNFFKGKKNNIYSNTLSTFIGRKQEQEQLDCIEKKEKETFNKQLLNGEFIKNEIYSELKNGTAIVCNDYSGTLSLSDTFKLQRKIPIDHYITEGIFSKTRVSSPHPNSSKKHFNVIDVNSIKFNQTGLIRNEKYNKCIKNELINNRSDFFRASQKQNQSKYRLAQSHLQSREKSEKNKKSNFMDRYQQELKAAMEQRRQKNSEKKSGDENCYDIEQILL